MSEREKKRAVGDMPMPADFQYKAAYLHGKPRHEGGDPFRIRHPEMPCTKRAKIFAPFDALRGFADALAQRRSEWEG